MGGDNYGKKSLCAKHDKRKYTDIKYLKQTVFITLFYQVLTHRWSYILKSNLIASIRNF